MPQIQVNEIDQSVVTRVVSDDKVKILVPVIASFGPGYDGTLTSINTFTDVSDFNRVYGYTDAEFNPFKNDYSRIYATQLIEKGGAVSVVRVNNSGETATFNINGSNTNRTTAGYDTICPAVIETLNPTTLTNVIITAATGDTTTYNLPIVSGTQIIPSTISIKTADGTTYTDTPDSGSSVTTGSIKAGETTLATVNYTSGVMSITNTISSNQNVLLGNSLTIELNCIETPADWQKYTFCPQIESITAKYSGSFGNDLCLSISQINTTRVSESYQYANISVYYVQKKNVYSTDQNGGTINTTVITGVTLLENKRVSTNPNDQYYFEDVEFDFISINGTPSARSELELIWSNIGNTNNTTATKYSGFPVIPLRYTNNKLTVYNTSALLLNGTDFDYSDSVLTNLKNGFTGYYSSTGSWTVSDVNDYLVDVYGGTNSTGDIRTGIIPSIYTSIQNMYQDFTDPYVYDFDFITSGGFVYEEYELTYQSFLGPEQSKTLSTEATTIITLQTPSETGNDANPLITPGTVTIKVGNTLYIDNGAGKFVVSGTSNEWTGASITYTSTTNQVTLPQVTTASTAIINFYYNDSTKPKKSIVTLPITSYDDSNYAVYNDITPIHAAMLNLVNTRQDCIALFDVPSDYDKTAIVEYSRMLNTSYGTMHHPWCWVQSPTTAGKNILMAPSYIFLYTFLSNLINNVESQKWFPPAGVKRATARVVKKPDYEIGSVILNAWQNNGTSRVNPIMKLKQYGYVIYGQYTTLPAIDQYTHSALESLNVRLISNVVKKKIFDACLNLAFEPNTSTLWLKFFAQMDEFLRYMKYNEGLYDYRIVMDESTVTTDDINQLRCPGKVYIAPTRTAEFFDIDFIITEAGAIFTQD